MNRRRSLVLILVCVSMGATGIYPALLFTTPTSAAQITPINSGATAIAFSPKLPQVAVGYANGDIAIWDVESRSQVLVISAHPVTPVSGLAYSPDGDRLASSGRDSVVRVWDVATGTMIHELHGHAQPATGLAFSPDATILASSGEDTRVLIWNVEDGQLIGALTNHKDMVTDVAVHPNGKLIASAARNGRILLSNVESGETVQHFLGHSGAVTSVGINDSGTDLISGGEDTTVRVWDLESGEQKRKLRGHSEAVLDVVFRPDNGEATSVSADRTSIVWDTEEGTSKLTTVEGAAPVTSVAYSSDGTLLAVGMTNGLTVVRESASPRVVATFMYNPRPTNEAQPNGSGQTVLTDSNESDLGTLQQATLDQASLTTGPGGPILVVTPGSSPFAHFYGEILRTEGFNAFATQSLANVTASVLEPYSVVILTPSTLTSAQVTMFTNWVNAGGNLIAMRPDKQLAPLLGLNDAGGNVNEGYLKVVNTAPPGTGITAETVQFHGSADRYTLNGATGVATLYSNATSATNYPAVTLRQVGSNGGQAGAFTYDLARSIVLTRQGNTAWNGQERDGFSPIRSNDQYHGAALSDPKPDWVDLNKVSIPQADEQMRLLSNMILHVTLDRMPIPRFWYYPNNHKAVVVMTGDDHGNNGTQAQFNTYIGMSPAGCSVEDWECVRATSYIFPNTPLSNANAANFHAQGFEIGLHVNTFCQNYSPSSLQSNFSSQLNDWKNKYTSLPAPQTNRTHCIAWSDWTTQASVSLDNGIRLDTNYYYWPPGWVADRPGFFTGTGMPMRFVDLNGNLIDVYHVTTQITDESGQTQPFTINSLLDGAIGPKGYYGVFTVNAHTDMNYSEVGEAVVSAALSRGVPVVSSKQMLTWVDGRNNSTFDNLNWSDNSLSFSVTQDPGARGLQGMLPRQSASGVLTSLTLNGNNVSFNVSGIKGVEYAVFPATSGQYVATYGTDTEPPTIVERNPAPDASGASIGTNVTAKFSEAMDPATINTTTFTLVDTGNTAVGASVTYDATTRTATLDPSGSLTANTTYTATVNGGPGGVRDLAGNPLPANSSWTFTTESGPQCPCTIWPSTSTPTVVTQNDPNAVELGVKFRSDVDGVITGLRFYKGSQNTGTHTGSLWTSSGQLLARVIFSGETSSGWQQMLFSQPVPITANTMYIASYHTTSGFYSANGNYFTSGVTRQPLYAFSSGESGGNGVYNYSGTPTFPTLTFNSANYWVDVVFETSGGGDTTPPTVLSTSPPANAPDADISANVTATFSESMDTSTLTTSTFVLRDSQGSLVTADVSYDAANRTAILNPAADLQEDEEYTATVSGGPSGVADLAGNRMENNFSWSFTTAAPVPDTTPPAVESTSPQSGATAALTDANITVRFDEPVDPATVTSATFQLETSGGTPVPAVVSYDESTRTATLDPDNNLSFSSTHTATVVGGASGVRDLAGNPMAEDYVWTFTTASESGCPCTIWPSSATPSVAAKNDPAAVEIGVRFMSSTDGEITGIRFYKGTGNTGTHTGSLWSSSGQLLAQAIFTNETETGWQEVTFATPVQITANTTYIASYHAPAGRYALNENYFTTAVVNGPLQALQSTSGAGNGVYVYSSNPAFPSQTWNASNYWVDVVFVPSGSGSTPPLGDAAL